MIPGEAILLLVLLLFAAMRPGFLDEPEYERERERDLTEWLHEAYEDYERPSYEPQEVES